MAFTLATRGISAPPTMGVKGKLDPGRNQHCLHAQPGEPSFPTSAHWRSTPHVSWGKVLPGCRSWWDLFSNFTDNQRQWYGRYLASHASHTTTQDTLVHRLSLC